MPKRSALIDANVFMYAIGRPHRLKGPSQQVIEFAASCDACFADAEVFQEILYRYTAIRRWPAVRPEFASFVTLFQGRVEPMTVEDVEVAGILAGRYPRLTARDLIHVAVALRVGAPYIVTADTAFEGVDEIERLDPLRIGEWRERVLAAS